MFLDFGKKPKYLKRTHTYKLHTNRLQMRLELGTFLEWIDITKLISFT